MAKTFHLVCETQTIATCVILVLSFPEDTACASAFNQLGVMLNIGRMVV